MARRAQSVALIIGLTFVAVGAAHAQAISGRAFEDRDADGILDPGEPLLEGVPVELFGQQSGGGNVDQSTATLIDGSYSFSPGNGCYVLLVGDPEGWRMSQAREDLYPEGTPGYLFPVGEPRFGKIDQGIGNLKLGNLDYAALGDSIAYNFNFLCSGSDFWYSRQIRNRLQCAAPLAVVTLDEAAQKGEHTDDLLVDDSDNNNNVFRMIDTQPELISISMIGNDLLDVDVEGAPSQPAVNRAVAEVLDARQNLQEALSVMISEIPDADIALNTLYDNLTYNCYGGTATSEFHRTWVPIMNRMLRDVAWGQVRRVTINEVASEFAQEDQLGACSGYDGMICRNIFDNIHPTDNGYEIILEKVWEGIGGTSLGSDDVLNRTTLSDVEYGFLRKVRRLHPTTWETLGGAAATTPGAALDDDDGGLAAGITLGIGSEEFRLAGFPDWYDEIRIVRVVAGVRYRTTGTVNDDFYRMEASLTGQFRPAPGHDYTPLDWNYYTPMVGGGGPNMPVENPDYGSAKLLAVPNVPAYREVSALVTKNPVLPGGEGQYQWPAVTHEELAATEIRVAAAPVAGTPGNDAYTVELDGGWLDLYGWEVDRPGEAANLRASRLGDGSLEVSFDEVAGAGRYNLYFGRLDTVRGGGYDHGGGAPVPPDCDAATQAAGAGRLEVVVPTGSQPAEDAYFLVTAHVDDVESPAGFATGGGEIDRSQSVCK